MHTFDCFRDHTTGELTLICTTAPVAIDRDSGASVTLRPALIDGGLTQAIRNAPHGRANGWWGELAAGTERHEARLALVIDGAVHNATVRWPEPEPEPKPTPPARPKRLRRVK